MVELLGVYKIENEENVHLIELKMNSKASELILSEFTQEDKNLDKMDWQVPYEEVYLDNSGTRIIGDYFNIPEDEQTRLAFFFHFLDFQKPLITPFGNVILNQPNKLPERLKSIIKYEKP